LIEGRGRIETEARGRGDAPAGASGLSGVIAVSAGGAHSLALLSNGTVMADEVGEPPA
jgi:hypothetical protein